MSKITLYIFIILAIIISGGNTDTSQSTFETLNSVEVLKSNGSFWCFLPELPQSRSYHTMSGLSVCGGFWTPKWKSCLSLNSNGTWTKTADLLEIRYYHVSWQTSSGLWLMGGDNYNSGYHNSTEVVTDTGSKRSFSLLEGLA